MVRFNTQPPEGGWGDKEAEEQSKQFQHTAARRRLANRSFQAHAGDCFNTQPPEGGCKAQYRAKPPTVVSTHSRPKAAVGKFGYGRGRFLFQHTAARRRLVVLEEDEPSGMVFQHTAARRRLLWRGRVFGNVKCFNTQPPEGGCRNNGKVIASFYVSTHSRLKAAETSYDY